MAVTRLYLRNTQTGGGTGGVVYDLSTTQGSGATLVSAAISGTSFTEVFRWQYTLGSDVPDTVIPTSIDVAAVSASTLEYRWRVERIDSSNNKVASSAYSTAHNSTGIKTENLSLSTAWASGDRVGISLELRRVSGGGSRTVTINVNDADSFIDPDLVPLPQFLTQNTRFGNSNTFYGPTVTAVRNLAPALFSNANAFYGPSVYTAFVSVQQDFGLITGSPDVWHDFRLLTDASTYTHDLGDLQAGGATQTLVPALFSNANTFYTHAMASTRELFPGLYSNANEFYSHTALATYEIRPNLKQNSEHIYHPEVTATNTLAPARLDNANVFYGPSAAATYALAPGLFSDGDTFYEATVQSSYGLQPGRVDNANEFYGPTVARGAIDLLPGLLSNINVFYSPVVSTGGFVILVPLVENENSFYDAEITVSGGIDGDLPRISRLFSTGQLMNRI